MQAANVEPIKESDLAGLFPSHRKVKLKNSMDEMPNDECETEEQRRSVDHGCSTQQVCTATADLVPSASQGGKSQDAKKDDLAAAEDNL